MVHVVKNFGHLKRTLIHMTHQEFDSGVESFLSRNILKLNIFDLFCQPFFWCNIL